MKGISAFLLCFVLFLTGCAKSTVVLLPDEDGTSGSVVVHAGSAQQVLNQPEQRVEATSSGLSGVSTMSAADVDRIFGAAIRALPEAGTSILIYFASESTHPTPKSMQELNRVLVAIQKRNTYFIEIFGHTDHLGKADYNLALSNARAREVQSLLIQRGIPAERMHEQGMGDRDPLVPAREGKAEPRNRRVEIFIR